MKKIRLPILIATLYLLVYTVASYAGAPVELIFSMYALAPFIVTWMAIRILKDGEYKGGELKGEWGYEDYDPYEKRED